MKDLSSSHPQVSSKILCLGEVSWDQLWLLDQWSSTSSSATGDRHILHQQAAPGGCALNSAALLSRLGLPTLLAGNFVGDDDLGRMLLAYLRNESIAHALEVQPEVQTPFCQCLVDSASGERSFILNHRDVQRFSSSSLASLASRVKAGEFTSAFVQTYQTATSEQFLQAVQNTPLWILSQDREAHEASVPLVNCLQVSWGEEAARLSMLELQSRATPYFRGRCDSLLVTCGSAGAYWLGKDESCLWQPSPSVFAKDTTGCGDAFRAGFMAARHLGLSEEECLDFGVRAGANKAQHLGSHTFANAGQLLEDLRSRL